MRLLITGTGRCGTTWFADALRMAGIDCGHERAFNFDRHGEDDWQAEASWLAAPYTPFADAYVVHLVRDPRRVIPSRAAWGTFGEPPTNRERRLARGRFAIERCPEIAEGRSNLERCAIHYVVWNRLIEADELLRIEDVTAADVERLARIVDPSAKVTDLPPSDVHTARTEPLATLPDVPGLREIAEEYGYL